MARNTVNSNRIDDDGCASYLRPAGGPLDERVTGAPILSALDTLDARQNTLAEYIGVLANRLESVLKPEGPSDLMKGLTAIQRSPMAHRIDNMAEFIESQTDRVRDLLERLEL